VEDPRQLLDAAFERQPVPPVVREVVTAERFIAIERGAPRDRTDRGGGRLEAMPAPTITPCFQSRASYTRGATSRRRPPNRIAENGHAFRVLHQVVVGRFCFADHREARVGVCRRAVRLVVRAACQSVTGVPVMRPSHHGSLSAVTATLV